MWLIAAMIMLSGVIIDNLYYIYGCYDYVIRCDQTCMWLVTRVYYLFMASVIMLSALICITFGQW